MGLGGGQPIIDGWIIPEDLSVTFANGKQNPVDVIAGYNKDEHTGFGGATNTNTAQRDAMAWHARLARRRTSTPSHTNRPWNRRHRTSRRRTQRRWSTSSTTSTRRA